MVNNNMSSMSSIEVEKLGVIEQYISEIPEKALHLGIRVLLAIIGLAIGVWLIRLVRSLLRKSMERAAVETGAAQFVESLVNALLIGILVLTIAVGFGLDAATVVAMIGSVGMALALAMQGSLSNLAGGVLILATKPFFVGDYICEASTGQEGTVTQISLFYTRIVKPDGTLVILPNKDLANQTVINKTPTDVRRMDIPVSISYDEDIERVRKAVLPLLDSLEFVIKSKDRDIYIIRFAESGIDTEIRFWVKNEDYLPNSLKINELIKKAFDEADIEIPYNQLDIHMKQ